MSVELSGIERAGDIDQERVVLRATADADIGEYAIFNGRAARTGNVMAGPVPNVYWFVDKEIKKGDIVVLYSKDGENSEKTNDDGTKSYFFYWRRQNPIWVPGRIPVLVETPSWKRGEAIKAATGSPKKE